MALLESAGFLSYAVAATLAPPVVVSPPSSLSSPMTVLFAAFFLGERPARAQWFFVGVAALGVIFLARG
jgi:drug/metabolite transporter (DMT)-like permease